VKSVVFCCVSFARSQSQSPTDSHLFATIDCGMLEGAHFGAARNEVIFLGIPYAAPPTGDRRWKAPQPVEKWPGVLKANSNGSAYPRAENPETEEVTKEMVQTLEPYYTVHTDEDCNPNGPGLPQWPAYDPKADLVFEIGHEVKLRPSPPVDRFAVFEGSLNSRLASIQKSGQSLDTTPEK
jgi:carboxylesterase type B